MNWNYRIIKHDTKESVYFAVHEVFYDEKGRITAWTEDAINITGDTAKDVNKTLRQISEDTKQPILSETELIKQISV